MKIYKLILFASFLLSFVFAKAHARNYFNLNVHNGLPSNFVYSVLTDPHGYLWMATTNGVVRYNGYTFQVFTMSEGLPQNDVWGLHCDKKGRVWLRAIAKKAGYILNDKYHNVYLKNIDMALYPKYITDYDSGVMFTTGEPRSMLLVEKDDTITNYGVLDDVYLVNDTNQLWHIDDKQIRKFAYTDKDKLKAVGSCRMNEPLNKEHRVFFNSFHKFIFRFQSNSNLLRLYNTYSCTATDLYFDNDIRFADYSNNNLYVITDNSVSKVDTSAAIVEKYDLNFLSGGIPSKVKGNITNCYEDAFWGTWITTSTNGIYSLFEARNGIQKSDIDLKGFTLIGTVSDSISFWWNNTSRTMLQLDYRGNKRYKRYRNITNVHGVTRWNKNELLLFSFDNVYAFDYKKETTRLLSLPKRKLRMDDDGALLTKLTSTRQALPLGDSNIIVVGRAGGVFRFREYHDTIIAETIDANRVTGAEYDRDRNGLWLYEEFGIKFQSFSGGQISISDKMLSSLGFQGIEKVIADEFGNLLVKDYNGLYVIDIINHRKRSFCGDYNIRGMSCYVTNDKIVLVGKTGALFIKVLGKNAFSTPVFLPNIKNSLYQYIEHAAILNGKVILKTDENTCAIDMPADRVFNMGTAYRPKYKLLAYSGGIAVDLDKQQNIVIDQRNPLLQFDVINPTGTGSVTYAYKLEDSSWQVLTTNELYLSQLEPGSTYRLSLKVHDDMWRSKNLLLTVFVQPYWWQTGMWKAIFILLGLLVIAALVISVTMVTRHFLNRENEKKRSLIQLELRAIYSQLNPHFIFNTLNSTTYFIKKGMPEAALDHLNKFASLLRRYLESTRNRQVLLVDEILNLKNYIELQQVRFGNKFSYTVDVDTAINADRINIPSLLIQPFVENAINHGLVPKDTSGQLHLRFKKGASEKEIVCVVEDDGIGRERSALEKATEPVKKGSYGNLMIRDLTDVLNKYEHARITIEYIDKKPPITGTVVTITIKNTHL